MYRRFRCLDKDFSRDYNKRTTGLVAQLGERTVRIRKVEGSIPFESTKKKATLMGGFSRCGNFAFYVI